MRTGVLMRWFPLAAMLATGSALGARDDAPEPMQRFGHAEANVRVDGRLDETVWAQVLGTEYFRVTIPDSLAKPRYRTLFRVFYTERGLYLGWDM
ncbi:MAG: hypothetical protein F4Z45_00910, partial [Gammaproteobacteria bacterium]|nr:hypothetical protein [Gammaproteobacteria bacterium]